MDAMHSYPLKFTQSPFAPTIIQAALVSLELELENPLTAVLHFIGDALGYIARRAPSAFATTVPTEIQTGLRELISAIGSELSYFLLKGMIYSFPTHCVCNGARTLAILIGIEPVTSMTWVEAALRSLPQETLAPDKFENFVNHLKEYESCRWNLLMNRSAIGVCREIQFQIQDFVAFYRRRMMITEQMEKHVFNFNVGG